MIAVLTDRELPQVEKKRVLGVHRVGHQPLGQFHHSPRGAAVVQSGGGQHVQAEHRHAQDLGDPGIDAPALLVAGRSERGLPGGMVAGQGFQDGRTGMVHA
jgi:hypothetical protein